MKRIVCHNAVATHFVRHTVTDAMEQWYWVTRVREQSTDFGNFHARMKPLQHRMHWSALVS